VIEMGNASSVGSGGGCDAGSGILPILVLCGAALVRRRKV
jgi:hypothetical protein